MAKGLPRWLGGRVLSAGELQSIRRHAQLAEPAVRAEVARRVCRVLGWTDAAGRPKLQPFQGVHSPFEQLRSGNVRLLWIVTRFCSWLFRPSLMFLEFRQFTLLASCCNVWANVPVLML